MDQNNIPEITEAQFALWKYSPVTQTVFQYLRAYQEKLKQEHIDRWMTGEADKDPEFESRARGVCIFVDEFLQLSFLELQRAYGNSEEQGENVSITDGRTSETR